MLAPGDVLVVVTTNSEPSAAGFPGAMMAGTLRRHSVRTSCFGNLASSQSAAGKSNMTSV
jgi:hypothetical protein